MKRSRCGSIVAIAAIGIILAATTPGASDKPHDYTDNNYIVKTFVRSAYQQPSRDCQKFADICEAYGKTGSSVYVGSNTELADDLHLEQSGKLVAILIDLNAQWSFIPISGTVRVYENNDNDSYLGPLIAGPFDFTLPPSQDQQTLEIIPTDSLNIPENIWVSVEFEETWWEQLGIAFGHDPSCLGEVVGNSHDHFLIIPSNEFYDSPEMIDNFSVCVFVESDCPPPPPPVDLQVSIPTGESRITRLAFCPTSSLEGIAKIVEVDEVRIVNIGEGDAPSFSIGYYISNDALITQDDFLLSALEVEILEAGSESTLPTVQVTIPPSLSAGCYYIGILLDNTEVIGEANEDDNYLANQFNITNPGGDSNFFRLCIEGGLPPIRARMAFGLDQARNRLIIHGGFGYNSYVNDTWALDLSPSGQWQAIVTPQSPPGRESCASIYDPVRERLIVFGGLRWYTELNDVWALSLFGEENWVEVFPQGSLPEPRQYSTAVYDPVRDRMLVFGGYSYPTTFNDVWALHLSGTLRWEKLVIQGTPPSPRSGQTVIYDPGRDRVVLFGGYLRSSISTCANDTWELSLGSVPTWEEVDVQGALPNPRWSQGVYDESTMKLLVIGGHNGEYYDDVWSLDLNDPMIWQELPYDGCFPRRSGQAVVFDSTRDTPVLFGGSLGGTRYNETFVFKPVDTNTSIESEFVKKVSMLQPVYPNPFNPLTTVSFTLPATGKVRLAIYDAQGREVARVLDEALAAGAHKFDWTGVDASGRTLPSGMYFCRLMTPWGVETRKLSLIR